MALITLALTGQALLHGPVASSPQGEAVSRLLRGADAAFANLEASVECEGAWPTKTKTLHRATPAAIASLRDLGFAALSHANNHAFDLGPPGIARTREVAERAGLQLTGSGRDRAEAAAPALLGEAGRRIAVFSVDLGPQPDIVYAGGDRAGINPLRVARRITLARGDFEILRRLNAQLGDNRREAARAAVGYRPRPLPDDELEFFGTQVRAGLNVENWFQPNPEDFAALRESLIRVRGEAAVVVVALHGHHWDSDWARTPDWLVALARDLIDAGADCVVGTGAPVLQPIAFHCGKPMLLGLGNFIFHTARAETYDRQGVPVWTGATIFCTFDAAGASANVAILPIAVGRPPTTADGPAPPPTALGEPESERVFTFLTAHLDDGERRLVLRL